LDFCVAFCCASFVAVTFQDKILLRKKTRAKNKLRILR